LHQGADIMRSERPIFIQVYGLENYVEFGIEIRDCKGNYFDGMNYVTLSKYKSYDKANELYKQTIDYVNQNLHNYQADVLEVELCKFNGLGDRLDFGGGWLIETINK
jgi:hypothetical protein